VLLPHLANVKVEEVDRVGRSVLIMARTLALPAVCPGCGTESMRVHSRYVRRLLDTAVGGSEVVICLGVRRFFCCATDCPKVTFAEQVDGLASKNARRTPAVTGVLESVALALGGRAGARLSGRLAAAVSRMTLIRLVRGLPDPAVSASPRVLGWTSSRCARAAATGHCWSTSKPAARLTSCRNGHRTPSPRGWLPGRERS
jgi:hypothetical protein